MFAIGLLVLSLTVIDARRRAGLYMDNGLDQTSVEGFMTHEETRELESQVLNLLELPRKPRKFSQNATIAKSSGRFLMDIYKELSGNDMKRKKRSASVFLDQQESVFVESSDMITAFECTHIAASKNGRGRRLWFDITGVPKKDQLLYAELRVFKIAKQMPPLTIKLRNLIRNKEGITVRTISNLKVKGSDNGWLHFNITKMFSQWATLPDANEGIHLSVKSAEREVRAEDAGLLRSASMDNPFVVAFWKSSKVHPNIRIPRSALGKRKTRKSDYQLMMRDFKAPKWNGDWRSCRLQNLYISFKDLQWNDWIIAPEGYQAYYCGGECNFPLNGNLNATNHAIVQTLVHLIHPSKYPKPCCVPTKLTPISVLYHLNDSNVSLKKYKRMVVKGCGCL